VKNLLPGMAFIDTIRFTPTLPQAIFSLLLVYSNAPMSPDTLRVSGTGIDSTNDISDVVDQVPKEYNIAQNYPNPFNSSTVIRYAIPERSAVKLDIYNSLGQLVTTLIDREQDARYYEVKWERGAASGIFFYRFIAISLKDPSKQVVDVKKMILLK
jgi:hypothetical protein